MDRKYALTGLGYAILGMLLGVYMGLSKNHTQFVTHAHIMLIGFVVSFIYAILHKLWLGNSNSKLSLIQFYVHQLGTVILLVSLFLFYGGFMAEEKIGPFLGIGAIIVLVGMILMKILFIKISKQNA